MIKLSDYTSLAKHKWNAWANRLVACLAGECIRLAIFMSKDEQEALINMVKSVQSCMIEGDRFAKTMESVFDSFRSRFDQFKIEFVGNN